MIRSVITTILITVSLTAFGQETYGPRIDSLLAAARNASSEKADSLYMEVGHALAYIKPVEAISYLDKSIELSEQYQHPRITIMAHSLSGIAYSRIGSYDKSVEYFNNQIAAAQRYGIPEEVAWGHNNMANVLLNLKNYDIAKNYLQKAQELADSLHNDFISQFVLSKVGRYMEETGNYDSAIYYFNRVLEIRLKPPVDSINLSSTYRDLGNAYFGDVEYNEAKYYYGISAKLVDSTISDMQAAIDVNLARIYMDESKLDSALTCAHRAVSCARRFVDKPVLSDAFGIMGYIYYKLRNYEQAEKCFSIQIAYQDSVKLKNVTEKIFAIEYQQQLFKQKQDIQESKGKTKNIAQLSLVIAILVIGGVYFALRMRHKRKLIEKMNLQIEEHNQLLSQSISYASKIQKAVLPDFDNLGQNAEDKFMIFAPKIDVSGNFYWSAASNGCELLAIADSGESSITGGFISMLGSNILHEISGTETDPAKILQMLRSQIIKVMPKANHNSTMAKGVDISLMVNDPKNSCIHYSGIKFPLVIIRNGELIQLQDNSAKECFFHTEFNTSSIEVCDGDCIYMMTHGFCDQENESGEPMGRNRLFQYLLQIHHEPMQKQKELLMEFFNQWRGKTPQNRDLLISGGLFKTNTPSR